MSTKAGRFLRDGSRTQDPRLDRLVQFDERSRNFPVMEVVDRSQPRSRTWKVRDHLDQGQEGACVGFAFTHHAIASPRSPDLLDNKDTPTLNDWARQALYYEAQRIDPWEGGSYPGASPRYEGTSVLAGAQVALKNGLIDEYRWAFSEEELFLALSHEGPAVIGVNWYEGMFDPNDQGYLVPEGRIAGGHAILVYRNRVVTRTRTEEWYTLWNSWGAGWGKNGTAKLSREHMRKLLQEDGEACIPTR